MFDELRTYEFKDGGLWFVLEDVLNSLKLNSSDLTDIAPEDFKTLIDGTKLISECGFYYLALFESEVPEAKKLFKWVMSEVVPSIFEKGYYIKGENNELINNEKF